MTINTGLRKWIYPILVIPLLSSCGVKPILSSTSDTSNLPVVEILNRAVEVSDEFQISHRGDLFEVGSLEDDQIFYSLTTNDEKYYVYDLGEKVETDSSNELIGNNNLIQYVSNSTNKEISATSFFPSPSRRSVIFGELSQTPVETMNQPTDVAVEPSPYMGETGGDSFPLIYHLFAFTTSDKTLIDLGEFSGDFSQLFWSADEESAYVFRGDIGLLQDSVSPFGIWRIDIPKRTISPIGLNTDNTGEVYPRLFSNNGSLILLQKMTSSNSWNILLFDSSTKSMSVTPLEPSPLFWWIEDGRVIGIMKNCEDLNTYKIEVYDVEKSEIIYRDKACYSYNAFASIGVTESGEYIFYFHPTGNELYARKITYK